MAMMTTNQLKLFALIIGFVGNVQLASAQPPPKDPNKYVPGFGVFMDAIQLRHGKLWFAGANENWPLAEFLVEEIKEDFDDVLVYRPNYKRKTIVEITNLLLAEPLKNLHAAINDKDRAQFERAFDTLSQACNACHSEVGIPFIVIQRPTAPPLTNQQYSSQ